MSVKYTEVGLYTDIKKTSKKITEKKDAEYVQYKSTYVETNKRCDKTAQSKV